METHSADDLRARDALLSSTLATCRSALVFAATCSTWTRKEPPCARPAHSRKPSLRRPPCSATSGEKLAKERNTPNTSPRVSPMYPRAPLRKPPRSLPLVLQAPLQAERNMVFAVWWAEHETLASSSYNVQLGPHPSPLMRVWPVRRRAPLAPSVKKLVDSRVWYCAHNSPFKNPCLNGTSTERRILAQHHPRLVLSSKRTARTANGMGPRDGSRVHNHVSES